MWTVVIPGFVGGGLVSAASMVDLLVVLQKEPPPQL